MKRIILAGIVAAAIAAGAALANDSTAELAAGGLVLTRDDDIEMRSEDLFISKEEVRVKYRFFNTATADKTVRVAFPMPETYFSESAIGVPTEEPENLLGFRTVVDGKPVTAEVEQKALLDGRDITAELKRLGVPLQPHLRPTWEALDALPQAVKDRLVAEGLAGEQEYDDDGTGMKKHLFPLWRLATTYHWEQTFPAGRELVVEHSYRPAAGSSAGTSIGSPWASKDADYQAYLDRFCVDRSFLAGVDRRMREHKAEYPPFWETRISYILKTGGNWKKPIVRFRMIVDKGSADNLISFCATGVRKISPTQFEVVRENWRPDRDLDVLILEALPPDAPE